MRVGSGPCFQLVDGGWSGLTGLQLTGVVSGRVVGGSRPARSHLPIDATPPVLTLQKVICRAVKVRRKEKGLWRMVMKGVKVVEVAK